MHYSVLTSVLPDLYNDLRVPDWLLKVSNPPIKCLTYFRVWKVVLWLFHKKAEFTKLFLIYNHFETFEKYAAVGCLKVRWNFILSR